MPQRTTLADVKASRIPNAVHMCGDDPAFIDLINECQQRLIPTGTWWGLWARYRCAATEGNLVWPRQVAAILAGSVEQVPVKIRDPFFEFIELGYGLQDSCSDSSEFLTPDSTLPLFSPITGIDKLVKVYCDLAIDAASPVLILGFDENANWIRTLQGGLWLDGEVVLASTLGTLSTKIFSSITAVQKLETNGSIRLFEYDPVTTLQRAIGRYDYDDLHPAFRVTYIPELDTCASVDCPITVEMMCKLDFIPVKRDTDYMLIGCIPALKDLAQAIQNAERSPDSEKREAVIASGMKMAIRSLEAEARHYMGAPQRHLCPTGAAGPTNELISNLV